MTTHRATRFQDEEMGRLMSQVEQRIEGSVLALVIQRAGGKVVVSLPKGDRKLLCELLSTIDWAEIIKAAADQPAASTGEDG